MSKREVSASITLTKDGKSAQYGAHRTFDGFLEPSDVVKATSMEAASRIAKLANAELNRQYQNEIRAAIKSKILGVAAKPPRSTGVQVDIG